MKEKLFKSVTKSLEFEKSGETLSVTIGLENVSPNVSKESISNLLDGIYQTAKEAIC